MFLSYLTHMVKIKSIIKTFVCKALALSLNLTRKRRLYFVSLNMSGFGRRSDPDRRRRLDFVERKCP